MDRKSWAQRALSYHPNCSSSFTSFAWCVVRVVPDSDSCSKMLEASSLHQWDADASTGQSHVHVGRYV